MSRPAGIVARCTACGQLGHLAARGDASLCSPTARALALMRDQGMTQSQAAKAVGLTRQAVAFAIARASTAAMVSDDATSRTRRALRLVAETGCSPRSAAHAVGISPQSVYGALARLDAGRRGIDEHW